MKSQIFFTLLIFFFCACKNDPNNASSQSVEKQPEIKTPQLRLSYIDTSPKNLDTISHAVYLELDEEKHLIANILTCEKFTKETYKNYQIPTTAIDACGGWWAGAGEYFYIDKKKNGDYNILYGEMYEEKETDDYDYTILGIVKKDAVGVFKYFPKYDKKDIVGVYTLGGHDTSWLLIIRSTKENNLEAAYFEIQGMLPPVDYLLTNPAEFKPQIFKNFHVDLSDRMITSDIGEGQIDALPNVETITFFYKKSHLDNVLQLTKDETYDVLINQ